MLPTLQKLFRYEPGISLGQWIHDRITNNWPSLAAVFAGGGGMTYLYVITDWLNTWGPIGWGVAFLAGVLTVSVIVAVLSWAGPSLLAMILFEKYGQGGHLAAEPDHVHWVEAARKVDRSGASLGTIVGSVTQLASVVAPPALS